MYNKFVLMLISFAYIPQFVFADSDFMVEQSECLVEPMSVGDSISAIPISPSPFVKVASTSNKDIEAAIKKIKENNGGTLYFPKGHYTINYFGANDTILSFEKLNEFKLVGDGAENTVLKLEANNDAYGKQIRTVLINGADRLEVADITVEGNREFYQPPEEEKYPIGEVKNLIHRKLEGPVVARAFANKEQQSTLFLRNIAKSTYIHDSKFHEAGGDGVNVSNSPNLIIQNNIFDNNDRNGITIGGARGIERSENVLIKNNFFGAGIDTQQIDLELHGSKPSTENVDIRNRNVQIIGNTFAKRLIEDIIDLDQYGVTISEVDKVLIERNKFNGNPLFGIYATNVRIYNNKDIGGARFVRRWSSYDIAGNTFDLLPMTRKNWPAKVNGGLLFEETAGEDFGTLVFRRNEISSMNVDWPMFLHGVTLGHLENNRFEVSGSKDTIRIESNTNVSRINLTSNNLNANDISLERMGSGDVIVTKYDISCP